MVGIVVFAQADAESVGVSVTQIITAASIVLTVLMLGFSLWKGLRRARLRPLFDITRVVIQSAIAVAVPVLTNVVSPAYMVLGPALVGLALGLLQGQRLKVEIDQARLYATRSMVGFMIWGAGLVLMQGAGLANRSGLVEIGQAVTWLSIGISVGLILGRHVTVINVVRSSSATTYAK